MIGRALALTVLALSAALTQTPASPMTAGEVALLVNAPSPALSALLRQAFLSADPAVRVVAGREAAVLQVTGVESELFAALAREADPAVGAELTKDALLLSGQKGLPLIEPQVKRLGGVAAVALAEWLARVDQNQFIARLPELSALADKQAYRLGGIALMSGLQHPEGRDALLLAWMNIAPDEGWGQALSAIARRREPLETLGPVLSQALGSPNPLVREESVWFVLSTLVKKEPLPDQVVKAALPQDKLPQATEWEGFGRELVARVRNHANATDQTDLLKKEAGRHHDGLVRFADIPQLTASEKAAAAAYSPHGLGSLRAISTWSAKGNARLVPAIFPGVIASAIAAAGCRPDETRAGMARVTYSNDGRPQQILLDPKLGAPDCASVFAAFSRLTLPDEDEPAGENAGAFIVLPLTAGYLACSSGPDVLVEQTLLRNGPVPTGTVKAPRKIQNLVPIYPEWVQRNRIEGVVVMEGRISSKGCVSDAHVLTGVPELDVEALHAVAGWLFEPPVLDNRPIPVSMSVTVTFQLR